MSVEVANFIDDLVGTNPVVGDPRSEGDDHIRMIKNVLKATLPGLIGRIWRSQTKNAGYTVVLNDNFTVLNCTAALTLALTAAATIGNGFISWIHANGGEVTIDPNGAELVNGAATAVIPNGSHALLECDGTGWRCAVFGDRSNVVTPPQITAQQNDYSPTGLYAAKTLRLNSNAAQSVTGIAAREPGSRLTIVNVGTQPILFWYENISSAAANRFYFGHTLSGNHSMQIEYDGTSSRWRLISCEEPAGTLKDFAGGNVPQGYVLCDGSNYSRSAVNTAPLFAEIGATHGAGDGSTTFSVPDFRRRVAMGSGGSVLSAVGNGVGNVGGSELHTLAASEIPSHQHPFNQEGTNCVYGMAEPGGGLVQTAPGTMLAAAGPVHNTGFAGGGGAHNNVQPSLIVTKIIKL